MYDENQIFDDTIQTIKNTGHDVKTVIDFVNSIKDKTTDSNFVFTGQSTDQRYFQNNSEMPISMIENIPDAE